MTNLLQRLHIKKPIRELPAARKPLTANVSTDAPQLNPCQANTGYAAPTGRNSRISNPPAKLNLAYRTPTCPPGAVRFRGLQTSSLSQPVDLGCVVDRTEIKTRVPVCRSRHQTRNLGRPPLTLSPPTRNSQWTDDSLALGRMFWKDLLHVTSAWQQHEPLLWERLKFTSVIK